jgi:RNA polymerase sigma factor (TIGR02999 family)
MRFILVDHARAAAAQKRGGGARALSLDAVELPSGGELAGNLLALDQALERLREFSERQCQLVEYRFFGGLNYEEIADVMGTSVRTVKRDWTRARAWLYTYMQTAA